MLQSAEKKRIAGYGEHVCKYHGREIHMRVENGNNAAGASGAGVMMAAGMLGQIEDAQSKSIRKQIEEKQQQLSELSSKEDMTPEEKMKKRQELTKEISDLNMQLRQHQMEKRMQEKAEKQKQRQNAQNAGAQRAGSASKGKGKTQAAGLSTEGMSAMLSADASMKQAKVQGSVSNKMENRAGVLESEIKMDSASGGSTERKEAELAGVKEKAVSAAVAQAGSLREANESAREAAEAERSNTAERTEKTERRQTEHSGQSGNANTEEADSAKKNPAQKAEAGQDENKNAQGMAAGMDIGREKSQSELYPPVDVRI